MRRAVCRLEGAQGFQSSGSCIWAPWGRVMGGERKRGAVSWLMPEARSFLVRSNWLPRTDVPGNRNRTCFLASGSAGTEPWGSPACSNPLPLVEDVSGSIPRGLGLPGVPGTWLFPCELQTHTCSLTSQLELREGGEERPVYPGAWFTLQAFLSSVLQPLCLPLLLPSMSSLSPLSSSPPSLPPLLFLPLPPLLLFSSHLPPASPSDSLDLMVWAKGDQEKLGSAFQQGLAKARAGPSRIENSQVTSPAFSRSQSIIPLCSPSLLLSLFPGSPIILSSLYAPTHASQS